MGRALPRSFFARDADQVARALLGQLLVHEIDGERLACRVVETEAYFGPAGRNPHLAARRDMPPALRRRLLDEGDPASHSFVGTTPRNRIMYGPPGYAYVYLIYGMHECVNVVTGPEEAPEPQAVLLRAGEPVEGVETMRRRRRAARDTDIASGPAKLAQAMGITRALYGADLTRGPLRFEEAAPARAVDVTPRIGVVGGEDLPLRFVARGNAHASRRASRTRATKTRGREDGKS
ncbi:MAG TPA: DNA-3-methyladenine glycosylase [Candidatus Thermoplasmatota archaeon]|nr:DNA-3-methyladenine glycosylase [Candidatus Thermoplasmatota archaeon]